jgi:hypothetical protein
MGAGEYPTSPEEIRLMIRPESLELIPGRGWSVTAASFAGHDGIVTLASVPTETTSAGSKDSTVESETSAASIKVLVPAWEMPALGTNFDVNVIGAALAYSPF